MKTLAPAQWLPLAESHASRADSMTARHRARRAAGERHAVEDFLFVYYGTRPSLLRRWHPGSGVALEPTSDGPAEHSGWRWYATDADGIVTLDVAAFMRDRSETVSFIHALLTATAERPAFLGCFGLHEWAMVYRQDEHRHSLPLRLGQEGTDALVEAHRIRCSHFDAFRFFTPEAAPLNRVQPTRGSQVQQEQPGCLHAGMDLHKWSLQLGPAVPGDLALDCFSLAQEIRRLDMQASPYDLTLFGEKPVRIETAEGRAEYLARQRTFWERARMQRARLVSVCERLKEGDHPPSG